jgi:thymidylate kinase
MNGIPATRRAKSPTARADEVGPSDGLGRILLGVFETLERAGIPYCVLHGYETYPQRIKSDVDCMISDELATGQLLALLHQNGSRIGAEVVHYRNYQGYFIVLAGKNADGSPCFLQLDFRVDYELDDRHFVDGREVLQSRHRHKQFWVPAANLEFGCYLARKIAKGYVDDEHGQRLSHLYQQDPAGCRQQIARFWGGGSTALLAAAASSGDWNPVRRVLGQLGAEARRWATLRRPARVLGNWLHRWGGRAKRLSRPDSGLDIVFLGPDGAGKSSVVQAVRQALVGVFTRTACYSFPPALLRRLHRPPTGREKLPHALPPRSLSASVSRAVFYWFVYHTLGYVATVHLALARSTLVLHDRHLVDAIVDPKRYRYAGPSWLLRLIWRLVPKPDLVILLDAPAEVLQVRKQEVPFEETARQRAAYLRLVGTMRNGHVIDVTRTLEEVIDDVNDIILRHLTTRIARRLGLEPRV